MTCPSCHNELQKVEVHTDSGGRFDIDHCGRCGGSWFDPYEINRIPFHEVVRLAQLTVWTHKSQTNQSQNFHCPNDNHLLEHYHSDSLPTGVIFLRCKYCFGIWASQKALEEFKKKQEETVTTIKRENSVFPALSVVFIPALLLLLLFFSTFITITHFQNARDSRILAQSFIQNISIDSISDTSVGISFQTAKGLSTQITYGETFLMQDTKWISVAPFTSHSIILTNLKPHTGYSYTLTLEDKMGKTYTTASYAFGTSE